MFSEADRSLLGHFLEKCDMIKFARMQATGADNAELVESALAQFVQEGSLMNFLKLTPAHAFVHPWWLLLLLLLPVIAARLEGGQRSGPRRDLFFAPAGGSSLCKVRPISKIGGWLTSVLLLALALLIVALGLARGSARRSARCRRAASTLCSPWTFPAR